MSIKYIPHSYEYILFMSIDLYIYLKTSKKGKFLLKMCTERFLKPQCFQYLLSEVWLSKVTSKPKVEIHAEFVSKYV